MPEPPDNSEGVRQRHTDTLARAIQNIVVAMKEFTFKSPDFK
jgi:hypothetical protein